MLRRSWAGRRERMSSRSSLGRLKIGGEGEDEMAGRVRMFSASAAASFFSMVGDMC